MALVVKNLPANAGDVRHVDMIAGLGRSPEDGSATQSSILAWRIPWARSLAVRGVTKNQTRPKRLSPQMRVSMRCCVTVIFACISRITNEGDHIVIGFLAIWEYFFWRNACSRPFPFFFFTHVSLIDMKRLFIIGCDIVIVN